MYLGSWVNRLFGFVEVSATAGFKDPAPGSGYYQAEIPFGGSCRRLQSI